MGIQYRVEVTEVDDLTLLPFAVHYENAKRFHKGL